MKPINMGYCRFQNTFQALHESYHALNSGGPPAEDMSEERRALRRLATYCKFFRELVERCYPDFIVKEERL